MEVAVALGVAGDRLPIQIHHRKRAHELVVFAWEDNIEYLGAGMAGDQHERLRPTHTTWHAKYRSGCVWRDRDRTSGMATTIWK